MKYSGLYLIPNLSTNLDTALTTVSTLIQGVESSLQTATRQASWSLTYRAFRDTLPPNHQAAHDADGKPIAFAHAYQHLLHFTALDTGRTFVCIQSPGKPGTVTSIPVRQQDAYTALLRQQSAALWSPRHVLSVPAGASFDGGLCSIQIGEVRLLREGPQSGTVQSPGVVVCISTVIGRDDTESDALAGHAGAQENGAEGHTGDEVSADFTYAQALIRDCWAKIKEGRDLGRSEVREVMMAEEVVEGSRETDATVRMWCSVLRLRG